MHNQFGNDKVFKLTMRTIMTESLKIYSVLGAVLRTLYITHLVWRSPNFKTPGHKDTYKWCL